MSSARERSREKSDRLGWKTGRATLAHLFRIDLSRIGISNSMRLTRWVACAAALISSVATQSCAPGQDSATTVRVTAAAPGAASPAAAPMPGTPPSPGSDAYGPEANPASASTGLFDGETPSSTPQLCTAVSCVSAGGQYCGNIGNGCGGTLACGTCPAGWQCVEGLCVGDASCQRRASCQVPGAQYCGLIGDDCGGSLDCGGCAPGLVCQGGVCAAANCVPATCQTAAGRFCGTVGDGCGGTLQCADCPQGGLCGGAGIANLCAVANCTKLSCAPAGGGQYCGAIGDGCGGILDCGGCPNAGACGGAGVANVCPGTTTCQGLACQVGLDACAAGSPTRLSGTVYDPAGTLPLYNVSVYVPNAPLDPIRDGVSCETCDTTLSGAPIATALSGVDGRFVLDGVPSGRNIPLVLQVGRWRRQVTIPALAPCVNNALDDVNLTRLPRNRNEGHIPHIAVATGGSDALECLLRRVGIDDSEFTTDAGDGRVHLYYGRKGTQSFQAGGPQFGTAVSLWSNLAKLESYDMVVLSCEGGQQPDEKAPYIDNIEAYLDAGGRTFLSHLHYYWLRMGTPGLRGTAVYNDPGSDLAPTVAAINQTFPKGQALAQWLIAVNASTVLGQLSVEGAQQSVARVIPPTQSWITLPQFDDVVEYMTFNTPLAAAPAQQCGRAVLTDIHIQAKIAGPNGDEGGDDSDTGKPFPSGCAATPSSPQAKALEFMLFDLSACVLPDDARPVPPPPSLPASPSPPVAAPPPPAPPAPPPPPPPLR
jgi:hypothetical protein